PDRTVRQIRPLIVREASVIHGRRPATTGMSPEQLARFREAQSLHAGGMLDRARDLLVALDARLPHQPAVVTELVQVRLDRNEFALAGRIAHSERGAAHDSLLLGPELVTAEERLGRPRDAIATALEVWISTPSDAAWAS